MSVETPIKSTEIMVQPIYSSASHQIYSAFAIHGTVSRWASAIHWGGNTGEASQTQHEGALMAYNPFKSNRQFIKLEQSFLEQLEKHEATFEGQNKYALHEKMKLSADALLSCSPDKISLEITWDGSIFYKVIKNDTTIHFEHFLINEFDESDEAIMTIYNGDNQVLNYGDTLANTIGQLGNFFASYKIVIPQLA